MINSKLNSKLQIKFNPEVLDFKQRHLGVPHLEKVMLFNIDSNYSVDMTSISGSTVHFHSSFFENKKIPPLGNTTFNVVFLGREEGSVESNLFIHTTQGHFKYRVKGDSVFSPYRLRPIVNVKLPLNSSFSPVIYFHNPFQESLQIVEIYCSGGDFHLELPSGEMEGPKDMWEVAPFETKAIIRVRFFGETEHNHTSYVRIKLNNSEDLVVPLEIQVTPDAVLYPPQGYVDFGIGGSKEGFKTKRLSLCNPFKKAVRIASINSGSKSVTLEMLESIIPPAKDDSVRCVEVAKLVLNWKKAYENKDFYGKIVVKYKNANRKTEVPYYATIIDGGFTFNASQTTYFIQNYNNKQDRPENRRISVKNDFQSPVKLLNVSLPADARHYFQVTDFSPIVMRHADERVVFTLKFNPGVQATHMKLNTFIQLHTNISSLHIPLVSYDGKLDLKLPHKSKDNSMDLGLISVESKKDSYILVVNKNPIAIDIKQVTTSIPSGQVELMGCGKGNYETALLQESYANMTKCERLRSKEYAILKLSVRSGRSETQIWGDISINTQFEQLSIPVHFKIAAGKLEIGPDRLVFDQCFPYKICSHPLRIHSSFDHPMAIEEILSIPPDERITFARNHECKHLGHIPGRATTVVGTLQLDPNQRCDQECYLGIQDAETRVYWRRSIGLQPTSTCDLDLNLVNILYHRYLNETAHGAAQWQNLTMRMDTSEVKGHLFKTRVKMSWPTLIVNETFENKSAVTFPLTQVGNTTYKNVTIRNPASFDLLIQIVMDSVYPRFDILFEGLPPVFVSHSHDTFVKGKHGFFLETNDVNEQFPTAFKNSLTVQLKPNEEFVFRVGFKAVDSNPNQAFLIVRNNLTIVEMVQLSGRGALPHFKFGNRKPGSLQQPLLFEFGEKHLKDCDLAVKSKSGSIPIISLKRSFTAKNNGEIPIFINNFFINQMSCEGYGFKILNCEPTILLPNGTKKIDIEFTPDYTLAKVTRTLILDTSLNFPVNYTLVTTVPSYYLSVCSSAIERPEWEYNMYVLASSIMVFALTIALLVAVMDSDKICQEAVILLSPQNNVQHTLDLRSIGAQTRQELQSVKPEAEVQNKQDNVLNSEDKNSPGVKQDGEKYTAVVPTTGKTKKKNRKLSDQQERDKENHKKQWMEAQKLKHEEQKHVQEEANAKKHLKKHVNNVSKKLEVKTPAPPIVPEEETSSTTTESSHSNQSNSNEEKKAKKQVPVIEKITPCVQEKENVYSKTQQTQRTAKIGRIGKPVVTPPITAEKEISEKVIIEKVKPNRRERRDREKSTTSTKTQNGDRMHKVCGMGHPDKDKDRISPMQLSQSQSGSKPASPVPNSIWNENKASFSDVVGRCETPSTATATASPGSVTKTTSLTTKPTMYVEPYKQAFVPPPPPPLLQPQSQNTYTQQLTHSLSHTHSPKLAPIGSRGGRSDNNSDYSRFYHAAIESTNWFLDVDQPHHTQQPNLNTNNTNNPWLLNANQPAIWENPSYAAPIMNDANSATTNSNYLWGSSVWEPWTPPVQETWTPSTLRTPPGFAPQRSQEEEVMNHRVEPILLPSQVQQQQQQQQQPHQQQLERNGNFNPFAYPNIWTGSVQHTDPWLPRGQ